MLLIRRCLLIRHLEAVQKELELRINATRTGPRRNDLCDANIHIMIAIWKLINGLKE
jgi:hypothetical protein